MTSFARRGLRVLAFGAIVRVGFVQCGAPAPVRAPRSGVGAAASPPRAGARDPSRPLRGSEAAISGSRHVALGVPHDADPSDDYYLDESAFVLSYSPEKRVPNWVAWRLTPSDLGRVKRSNRFRPDLALPARFYRVTDSDYSHSGYDRGHLCPSADRARTVEDNASTFLFTNMHPQLHELNAGPWEQFEAYARERARRGQWLYQVAGGVFQSPIQTIGRGVAVPSASFKIVVALEPGQGPRDVSEQSSVLAVSMPNAPGVADHPFSDYLTSVDAIEQATGYDFLDSVPEAVQRVVEARIGAP